MDTNKTTTRISVGNRTCIGMVEIPDEMAKELSELLILQSVRERLLLQLVGDPKYDDVERMLIDTITKIDTIKAKITAELIPAKYRSDHYIWNYNGYETSGNKIEILG